jgi:hypothetical protein
VPDFPHVTARQQNLHDIEPDFLTASNSPARIGKADGDVLNLPPPPDASNLPMNGF